MTDEEIYTRVVELLKERSALQRTIRDLAARIAEIDTEIIHLDEQAGTRDPDP